MGSAITTSLLAIIDPLFTLSWALKASQDTWELLLPRAFYATSNQGRDIPGPLLSVPLLTALLAGRLWPKVGRQLQSHPSGN